MKLAWHCGNIEIEIESPAQLTSCNCSICRRYQSLWGYYTPENVNIQVGSGLSSTYIWGDKEIKFVHCSVCGCVTHYETIAGQPDAKVGVNFRMATDREIQDVPVRHFDGACE